MWISAYVISFQMVSSSTPVPIPLYKQCSPEAEWMLATCDRPNLSPCSSLKLDYHVSLQLSASETSTATCCLDSAVFASFIDFVG